MLLGRVLLKQELGIRICNSQIFLSSLGFIDTCLLGSSTLVSMYGGVTITLYDISVALACKKGTGYHFVVGLNINKYLIGYYHESERRYPLSMAVL
jgi:hypothetical protein